MKIKKLCKIFQNLFIKYEEEDEIYHYFNSDFDEDSYLDNRYDNYDREYFDYFNVGYSNVDYFYT